MNTSVSDPWLFGYGSLLFRRGFGVLDRQPARLDGWARRFWQGSPDHRGYPGRPGRVVTLTQSGEDHCDGLALRLHASTRDDVFERLDRREAAGYAQLNVSLRLHDGRAVPGVTYIATRDNANYLGPAPLASMADQINRCEGPSGSNRHYLLALAEALRSAGLADGHVFELEAAVIELDGGASR